MSFSNKNVLTCAKYYLNLTCNADLHITPLLVDFNKNLCSIAQAKLDRLSYSLILIAAAQNHRHQTTNVAAIVLCQFFGTLSPVDLLTSHQEAINDVPRLMFSSIQGDITGMPLNGEKNKLKQPEESSEVEWRLYHLAFIYHTLGDSQETGKLTAKVDCLPNLYRTSNLW